jgi:hypothetical protein
MFPEELAHPFQCGMFVPFRLVDEQVEHLAFGINGAPKVHLTPIDLEEDLVEMPRHVRLVPPFAQIRRNQRPEMVHPTANRLEGNRDAAFSE